MQISAFARIAQNNAVPLSEIVRKLASRKPQGKLMEINVCLMHGLAFTNTGVADLIPSNLRHHWRPTLATSGAF